MNQPFWAKYGKKDSVFYPLLYHCLDARNVARELLQSGVAGNLLTSVEKITGLARQKAINLIAFLVSLHDIGKAIPFFQRSIPEHIEKLLKWGFSLPKSGTRDSISHGEATFHIVMEAFSRSDLTFQDQPIKLVAHALAAHHGSFLEPLSTATTRLGDEKWSAARLKIIKTLYQYFLPDFGPRVLDRLIDDDPGNYIVLTGLISVSDWLASDQDFFKLENEIAFGE